jgi:hypothetical protein
MTRYSSRAAAVLRTRTAPWFVLSAAVFLAGLLVFGGTAQAALVAVGSFAFLGTAIRRIGLAVRDNEVSAAMLTDTDVVHGSILSEAAKPRSARSRSPH